MATELTLSEKIALAAVSYERQVQAMNRKALHLLPGATIQNFYVERTDTECLFMKKEGTCIMVFPGSESVTDFFLDALFWPSRYRHGGWVHHGFNKVARAIEAPVVETVNNLFPDAPPQRFEILGHSLGAQCALFAADALYFDGYGYIHRQITTFGCPNGWSREACEGFEGRHRNVLHVHNNWDYVMGLLGGTSGRPWDGYVGKHLRLKGKPGHMTDKYQANIFSRYLN